MKTLECINRRIHRAFTLIELLVVLAIIGLLAAMLFSVLATAKKSQALNVAQAELRQIQSAIESYKARRGHYPPDNPDNPALNQLYFELKGTTLNSSPAPPTFVTLDGSGRIAVSDVGIVFGPRVNGFMNFPRSGGAGNDDAMVPMSFLTELRPNQIGRLVIGAGSPANMLLVCSVRGSDDPAAQVIPIAGNPHATETGLNPWCYVSSRPTHNPGAYDLWVNVPIGGKILRVNNWSRQPDAP